MQRPPAAGAMRNAVPAYRADIDGLRALAVIAVLLFHSSVPGFEGGFAGVDVFFVVSGFLITRLLEESRAQSARGTLGRFYLRRIRRILPALLATSIATAVVAFALFMPEELRSLGSYLITTPLLLSNVSSYAQGNYFALRGPSVPLNHLWSIAVEEQFYLGYPLLLLLITRYLPLHRRAALLVVACASLALCIWASYTHPFVNYFLAPTRAWELLLGAALALGAMPQLRRPVAVELLAAASVLCLAFVVRLYGPQTVYPGSATLLPVLATAALIATGAQRRPALVNRALAWRPIVFVGLISYSLYLWHWPLLVFTSYYYIKPLGSLGIALVLGATVLVAILSWRFIEQPVRTRTLLPAPAALLAVVAATSALVLVGGVVLWNSDGFPRRFSPEMRMLFADVPVSMRWVPCIIESMNRAASGDLCATGSAAAASSVLVWGDSHALAMMPAYELLASEHRERLYLAALSSCPPLLPAMPDSQALTRASARAAYCARFNDEVLKQIMRLDVHTVILNARWITADLPAGVPDIASGIEQTVERIGDGRTVCVVLGVPALRYPLPYALVMARRRGMPEEFLTLSRSDALAQYGGMERALRVLPAGSLALADPKDVLCPGASCLYLANGHTLYSDDNHLSQYGAHYVMPALEHCFQPAAAVAQRRAP